MAAGHAMRLFLKAADARCAALNAYIDFAGRSPRAFPAHPEVERTAAAYEAARTELLHAIECRGD